MEANHFDDTNSVTTGIHGLDVIPTRFELLHNIEFLLSILSTLSKSRPLATAFAAQIYDELKGGKMMTDERPIGRVEFSLDGRYMMKNFLNGVHVIWSLL